MIIVVGGIKGGSGKTTIATNLTVMRASTGKKVLLVDADEQRSASDWAEQRESLKIPSTWTTVQLSGVSLNSQVLKLVSHYDDVIIDAGGRDTTSQRSALSIANMFLVPFKPRAYDVWTLGKVRSLIHETMAINPSLKYCIFLNQADAIGKDNEGALGILNEEGFFGVVDICIANRKVFSNTATEGKSIIESKPVDRRAVQEMMVLYNRVYENDINII